MYSKNQMKHSSEYEVKEGYPEIDMRPFCFILKRIHWRIKDVLYTVREHPEPSVALPLKY